jgi:hypothetical protein
MAAHAADFTSVTPREARTVDREPRHRRVVKREVVASTLFIVYLALLFLLPARLVVPGMGAAGRPAVVVGLALLTWWVATRLHPALVTRSHQPVRWILLGFTVAVMISYALAFDRGLMPAEASGADRYLLVFGSWAGVALVAADGLRRRGDVDRVLGVLVALASVSAAVGTLQFYGTDLAPYFRLPGLVYNAELVGVGQRGGPAFSRVYGTQQHYIEFGVVLAMVVPFAVHRALIAAPRQAQIVRWMQVALIAGAIPLAISRAGFLGLVTGVLVLVMAWPLKRKLWALIISTVSLLAFRAVVPGVLGTIKSMFLNYSTDPSIQARLSDYGATADYIRDRPWFGRGPGTYVPELYRVLDNQFLGSFLTLGYVGTLAFFAVFLGAYFIGRAVRRMSSHDRDAHLGQAIAASAAVGLVASFTFDSLSFPTFAGLLFLVLGMSGALWTYRNGSVSGEVSQRRLTAPALY